MAKTLDDPIDKAMVRALALLFAIVCMLALSATAAAYAAPPGRSNVPADKTRELHVEASASSSGAPRLTPMLAPADSGPSFAATF